MRRLKETKRKQNKYNCDRQLGSLPIILFCFRLFLLLQLVFPAFMAHGDIAVVCAQEHLVAGSDDPSVRPDPGVYRGFVAAGADGLDFGDRVSQLHQTHGAGEKAGAEIGSQAEAKYRDVPVVDQLTQLIDLLGGEKLGFIGDDHIALPLAVIFLTNILVRSDDPGAAP